MSFPSLETENLSEKTREKKVQTFVQAFKDDLPKGMRALKTLARKAKDTNKQVEMTKDPDAEVGQQIIRLLGADIARAVVEEYFNVEFGLYNCCTVVAAGRSVEMSFQRQAQLQSPEMVDC